MNRLMEIIKTVMADYGRWLFIAALALLAALGFSIWDNFRSHTTPTTVHVTAIENAEDLISASYSSDFYFRLSRYESGKLKAAYSALVPLRANIGLDLGTLDYQNHHAPAPAVLDTEIDWSNLLVFQDDEGRSLEEIIQGLMRYSEINIRTVALSDPYFINGISDRTAQLLTDFLGQSYTVESVDVDSHFAVEKTAVDHVSIKRFISDDFPELELQESATQQQWNPNLKLWRFQGDNQIQLQYLSKVSQTDMDRFFASMEADALELDEPVVLIRLYKSLGDRKRLFVMLREEKNKVSAFHMDANGHIYLLQMVTKHRKALMNSLPYFLSMVHGLAFSSEEMDNRYADQTQTKNKRYQQAVVLLNEINEIKQDLMEEGEEDLMPVLERLYLTKEPINLDQSVEWDQRFYQLRDRYDQFPDAALIDLLTKKRDDHLMLAEGLDQCDVAALKRCTFDMEARVCFAKLAKGECGP
ncbi:MAG: hypothetical protein HQL54_00950 [Magnetococcales bacterium]|nr:hypothetical protein [Magnetococcales bacterium]